MVFRCREPADPYRTSLRDESPGKLRFLLSVRMSLMFTTAPLRSRRFKMAITALLLLLSACQSQDPDNANTKSTNLDGTDVELTSALQSVESCDELLDRIKTEALERVGPFGLSPGGYFSIRGDFALEEEAMTEAATDGGDTAAPRAMDDVASSESTAGSESSFSGTNNQERGVDEGDLVKTDGDRLVVVAQDQLQIIDVTGDTPRLDQSIQLPQDVYGGELFLKGNTVLLMTTGWTNEPFTTNAEVDYGWYPGYETGRLMEFDLSEGKIVRSMEFEGSYLSAREIDGSIRIVVTASSDRLSFVQPQNQNANDTAEKANRQIIEDSTIEQWIPTYRIVEGSGFGGTSEATSTGAIVDCDRVFLPSEFAGFGSLIVLTADIEDGLQVTDSTSIFTDAQTAYASTDRLVIATPRWPEYDNKGEIVGDDNYSTALHSFNIEDPNRTDYVASGSVAGHMLSQYSLSEHDGYLRVATTDGDPWRDRSSESFVTVFEESGSELNRVGQVGGLGKGEQIFAVRFLGDRGYVVTFEQIDPLYTLDLSDPTNPTVEGELKIPGFSSYLHPIDDNLLLGVGTDGDDDGRTFGTVISMFDVSDPSNPTRIDKYTLTSDADGAESGTSSPVSYDPRAFTYWNQTSTAIVPLDWWSWDPQNGSEANGSSAILLDIDDDGMISETGRVSHPQLEECDSYLEDYTEEAAPPPEEDPAVDEKDPNVEDDDEDRDDDDDETKRSVDAEADFVDGSTGTADTPGSEPNEFCYSWTDPIVRTVIIGDNLLTVSGSAVMVNDFETLDEVTFIDFK